MEDVILLIALGFIITFFQKAGCLLNPRVILNLLNEFKRRGPSVAHSDGHYKNLGKMEWVLRYRMLLVFKMIQRISSE